MKKIIFGMLASCFILAASVTQTKAQVSVNLNVGSWTPPAEYANVDYYYLPDVDSYYYVPTHQYVVMDGSQWVFVDRLPARYSSYNINNGYKVAVNRPKAYRYYSYDRDHYNHYRGNSGKTVIVRDHYKTRVVNHTRVVNNTRYVHKAPKPNRSHFVKGPEMRKATHKNAPHGPAKNHGGGDHKGHH